MPSVLEFYIFRTPKPGVEQDTSPAKRVGIEAEPKVLDDIDTRIAAAMFNHGPDAIEILLNDQPVTTLAVHDGVIVNGNGDLSGHTVAL
jgi:hypothetical protein